MRRKFRASNRANTWLQSEHAYTSRVHRGLPVALRDKSNSNRLWNNHDAERLVAFIQLYLPARCRLRSKRCPGNLSSMHTLSDARLAVAWSSRQLHSAHADWGSWCLLSQWCDRLPTAATEAYFGGDWGSTSWKHNKTLLLRWQQNGECRAYRLRNYSWAIIWRIWADYASVNQWLGRMRRRCWRVRD